MTVVRTWIVLSWRVFRLNVLDLMSLLIYSYFHTVTYVITNGNVCKRKSNTLSNKTTTLGSAEESRHLDPKAFRQALGHFATGVTVITAKSSSGELVGITANSFNSVSLDPPMVLWSLARSSLGFDLFTSADHFCVNILAENQVDVSNHFAAKKLNKFDDIVYTPGIGGAPVLEDTAANFQCHTAFTYEGGDHLIFVGEVLEFNHTGKPGLVFHQGQYAVSDVHPFNIDNTKDTAATGFIDDYLDYLLTSAAHRYSSRFQETLDKTGREADEWHVLAVLSDWPGATFERIRDKTLLDAKHLRVLLAGLEKNDLVSSQAWGFEEEFLLTNRGEQVVLNLLAAAKACESDILAELTTTEVRSLKHLLKQINNALM